MLFYWRKTLVPYFCISFLLFFLLSSTVYPSLCYLSVVMVLWGWVLRTVLSPSLTLPTYFNSNNSIMYFCIYWWHSYKIYVFQFERTRTKLDKFAYLLMHWLLYKIMDCAQKISLYHNGPQNSTKSRSFWESRPPIFTIFRFGNMFPESHVFVAIYTGHKLYQRYMFQCIPIQL